MCDVLQLLIRQERWFANLFDALGVQLAEISADLLIASSHQPGKLPNDPADRILAATARDLGATLVTIAISGSSQILASLPPPLT